MIIIPPNQAVLWVGGGPPVSILLHANCQPELTAADHPALPKLTPLFFFLFFLDLTSNSDFYTLYEVIYIYRFWRWKCT